MSRDLPLPAGWEYAGVLFPDGSAADGDPGSRLANVSRSDPAASTVDNCCYLCCPCCCDECGNHITGCPDQLLWGLPEDDPTVDHLPAIL